MCGCVLLQFRPERWQRTSSHSVPPVPWREVVLVSGLEMRDGVSQCIHGTFPERNLLVQLNEKKMENTFG